MDFTVQPPVPVVSSTSIPPVPPSYTLSFITDRTYYGPAAISNDAGQLQLYAYADTIWDKNGNLMQNGSGLMPAFIPMQDRIMFSESSMLTVPFLGGKNKNMYYVFSLKPPTIWTSDDGVGRLYYSVVDMSLNGGLGAVVPGQKGILLDTRVAPRLIAVPGSECNIWVVTMSQNGKEIHAFEVTKDGIATTPVISPFVTNILPPGVPGDTTMFQLSFLGEGAMRASSDNSRLVVGLTGLLTKLDAQPFVLGSDGLQLYDFDNATGTASNQMNFPFLRTYNTPGAFGALTDLLNLLTDLIGMLTGLPNGGSPVFSPDNSKLYYTRGRVSTDTFSRGLLQFDLASGTQPGILASRRVLDTTITSRSGLRLGADDKVYLTAPVGVSPGSTLHRIEDPNQLGTAATLTLNAVILPTVSRVGYGFGPPAPALPPVDSTFNKQTLSICAPDTSILLSVPFDPEYTYLWDDGSTDTNRTVRASGTYWVVYGLSCPKTIDTFVVKEVDTRFSLGNDTTLCNVSAFLLHIDVPGASYQWQDGSTNQDFNVTQSGPYSATAAKDGCSSSDAININMIKIKQNLGPDTAICTRTPFQVTLKANVPPGSFTQWSTGSTADNIDVSAYGKYYVTVRESICTSSDTITISTELCDCITMVPNAFSPDGDGLNDVFEPKFEEGCLLESYLFEIFNRYGQRVFYSIQPAKGWNGTYPNGQKADVGNYYFKISYEKGTHHFPFAKKGDVALIR
jgi:gliding motility-associated-like protein